MTNKEALGIVKLISYDMEYGGYPCTDAEEEELNLMALDKAIVALEKQIPKKPIKKMRDYICSYCSHIVYRTENFCSNCGNGIDWSNE